MARVRSPEKRTAILQAAVDAARRPFYGPGINNFDVVLHKVTKLTESKSLGFRFETFNTFNHAQFDGNGSVDGNINDATFGKVVKAAPPRISQVALSSCFKSTRHDFACTRCSSFGETELRLITGRSALPTTSQAAASGNRTTHSWVKRPDKTARGLGLLFDSFVATYSLLVRAVAEGIAATNVS
jgi:hypothetical protein